MIRLVDVLMMASNKRDMIVYQENIIIFNGRVDTFFSENFTSEQLQSAILWCNGYTNALGI